MAIFLSRKAARQYVLGRQGLWPGRRWRLAEGAAQAIRQCECVQIDTISAVARNHDLHLASRVEGYQTEMLGELMYSERRFFDYGDILMVYPREELPYWRAVMRWHGARNRDAIERRLAVIDHVRSEIRTRGPLASRDFKNRERVPGGFNMMKDSAIGLYLLWLEGEIVTHSRRGFDRTYDFAANIHGDVAAADDCGADAFFARKAVRDLGLATAQEWSRRVRVYLGRLPVGRPAARMDVLESEGYVTPVRIEGDSAPRWAPAEDVRLLEQLVDGEPPVDWRPVGPDTTECAVFLAPLDNVIWDRARTRSLFDFDYVWEVYKPAHLRRWGYYTLPILWGDSLVARVAPRLDRKRQRLTIEGFWLEDVRLADDARFRAALAAGLRHFCDFHKAESVDAGSMTPLLVGADISLV